MGIKNMIAKAGTKAADKVSKLSVLSPEQLQAVQEKREPLQQIKRIVIHAIIYS